MKELILLQRLPRPHRAHVDYRSARRRLPHWHKDGAIYWVCFRLADSIPLDKLRAWQVERALWCQANTEPWNERQWQEYNRLFGDRYETWLDAGMGSRALAREDVRQAVADCLMRFHGDRLLIHAAVIMPTHIHTLIEPLPIKKGGADIPVCAGQAGMPAPPCKDDIRPLPNLETNFVAANTLIGIAKPDNMLFSSDEQVASIERDLKANRHRHFFARTTRTKRACRKEDKRLRDALQKRLIELATKPDESVIAENLALIQKLEDDRANYVSEKWENRERHEQTDLFGATKPEQQALPLRIDVNKERRDTIDADIRHCQARIAAERTKAKNNAFTREAEKLALWDPYDQNATSPFFDPEWMFGITGGFDVVIGNPPYVRQESIKGQKPLLKAQGYESFEGTADLFVYFYERGFKMLAPEAHLCFITSNKYLRAGYGGNLRAFLADKNRILQLIDFGDAPVFEAIAYPSILLAQQGLPEKGHALLAFTWRPGPAITEFPARFATHAFPLEQSALRPDGWQLERREVLALLDKLRAAGTPLGDYVKGRFYRGILTGLNAAFVVDRATRDRLIAEHPSSAGILKPFLRGRDVKRWQCAFAEQYLIKLESSENAKHPWSGMDLKRAEAVFAKSYPAVHAFMRPFRQALIKRADQGNYFWELRSCAYWEAFEKPKIVYQEIATYQAFGWESDGLYATNKVFILPDAEKWLLALLNSSPVWWFLGQVVTKMVGGAYAMQWPFVSQIPIPPATPAQQAALSALVDRILAAKVGQAFLPAGRPEPRSPSDSSPSQTGMSAPPSISALEAEIDRIVRGLYGVDCRDTRDARDVRDTRSPGSPVPPVPPERHSP